MSTLPRFQVMEKRIGGRRWGREMRRMGGIME